MNQQYDAVNGSVGQDSRSFIRQWCEYSSTDSQLDTTCQTIGRKTMEDIRCMVQRRSRQTFTNEYSIFLHPIQPLTHVTVPDFNCAISKHPGPRDGCGLFDNSNPTGVFRHTNSMHKTFITLDDDRGAFKPIAQRPALAGRPKYENWKHGGKGP